jgi:hypothetical protein
MSIEIILGLPHLSRGALLERAKALQAPVLISANCMSRWQDRKGWREWAGWRLGTLANATGLASLDLDSAGFVSTRAYGGFPWTVDDYIDLAASWPFRRFASLDYCTEQEIARDREEVLDRISRTIRSNRDCMARAADRDISERFMPVIQGRTPSDYERCLDALWPMLTPGRVIGVGSMCRREVGGRQGIVAVFEHLDRVLAPGVKLHGFGIKGTALPYLVALAHRITSIDSQAYGTAARQDALKRGVPKTDKLVADHLERWFHVQHARLREPATRLTIEPAAANDDGVHGPWEQAIADARREIRDLIESGDLDHTEITAGWVEQWAAELHHARAPGGLREEGEGDGRARRALKRPERPFPCSTTSLTAITRHSIPAR